MRGWLIWAALNGELLVRWALVLFGVAFFLAGVWLLVGVVWRVGRRIVRNVRYARVRREMRKTGWAKEQAEKEIRRDYPKSSRKGRRAA